MNNKRLRSKKIALSGVFGALSLTLMLFGSIMPLSSYLAPALSGCMLIPIAYEFNKKSALVMFFAISILAVLIVPDRECAFLFLAFLGWYPIFKISFDSIKNKVLAVVLKFVVFNVSIALMYYFVLFIFPIQAIVSSFNGLENYFFAILIIMANVTFFIYDIALKRLVFTYIHVWSRFFIK